MTAITPRVRVLALADLLIEVDARKLLPGTFEVYEVEVRPGDLGGMPGVIGWMGVPNT